MSDNKNTILKALTSLNLSADEARIYLELLKNPSNHLELSRSTGINRTKVYRLVDQLEKQSLLKTLTDDQGTRLVAAEPDALEINLVTQEEKLNAQRNVYAQLLPVLKTLRQSRLSSVSFVVQTYEGVEGFKQMLWHELKANTELLIFGNGSIEDLISSVRWAERHRAKSVDAGYRVRELVNPGKKDDLFTKNNDFLEVYQKRLLPRDILLIEHQIAIYNDTVATYNWRGDQKVGVEIINQANADMMRQVFETYWELAKVSS